MAELYEIDLIRAILEHKLNDETIFLTSFYEQIGDADALERYGRKIYELINDQNRASYKARGVVAQNGEADIVNITSNYICPLEYSVRLDVAYYKQLEEDSEDDLSDVEYVGGKLNTLIQAIKGRKFDITQGEDGDLYVCNTPAINYTTGQLEVLDDVYMYYSGANDITDEDDWATIVGELIGADKVWTLSSTATSAGATYSVYFESNSKLYQVGLALTYSSGYHWAITSVSELETSFTKYKVSISVNNLQRDMPYDFNGTGRMALFFNGQATIADGDIMLGNDKIGTRINNIVVDPLELPSGSKMGDTGSYLIDSNYPKATTYNNALENTITYSFNVSKTNTIIMALYNLARKQSIASPITSIDMTYTIDEYDYQFGVLTKDTIKCKLDDVSITNTNGDIITIKATFKLGAY